MRKGGESKATFTILQEFRYSHNRLLLRAATFLPSLSNLFLFLFILFSQRYHRGFQENIPITRAFIERSHAYVPCSNLKIS